MRTRKLLIRIALDEPDLHSGYALAETMGEALELAEHPEAITLPTENKQPANRGERGC